MGYSAIASTLRTKSSELETLVSGVKSISFDSVWSGSAHDSMTTSLTDLISRTEAEISNINTFADALDSLQKYKEHREKINQLKLQYYNMPNTEENKTAIANLSSLINTLTVSNTQARNTIINTISKFKAVSSEIEVVTYDASVEDYGQFIVDIDSLVAVYANNHNDSNPADPLTMLNGGSLYDYYNSYDENGNVIEGSGKAYVEGIILDIRNKYSGRDAAVNSALAILQLAANKGIKLDYEHKGTAGIRPYVRTSDVASGVDCNPFVSWCVDKGVETGFQWRPVGNFRSIGTEIKRDDWSTAKPGDLLSSEGHIIMIVDNNPEKESFTIVHASGTNRGILIEEKPYSTCGNYSVRDMTAVYSGEENTDRWKAFSEHVDPNTFQRNLV